MIKRDALLDLFERMARENWAYAWGAAREGCVDCSGAFVFAYEQLGGPAIAHGSNSILRQSMGQLLPMRAAQPGYAAVKVRAWTDAQRNNRWYNQIPGDCYHIGLVGRDGRILNAQSTATGFVSSGPDEGWDGCAPLAAVDYTGAETGGDANMDYMAEVITRENPLNVRERPTTKAKKVGEIPRGEVVEILDEKAAEGWLRVRWQGVDGYAAAEYLRPLEDLPEPEETGGRQTTIIINDSSGAQVEMIGAWRVAQD